MEYNENLLSPEILSGWFNLFYFYGFIDDNYILFRYVGHNAFHITVYMDDVPQSGVNRYLEEIEGKEPLSIGPFDHFSIKLSRLSIQLSYLVSIKLIYFKMLCILFYFISIFLLFRYCCRIFLLNFHNIFDKGDSTRLLCMVY